MNAEELWSKAYNFLVDMLSEITVLRNFGGSRGLDYAESTHTLKVSFPADKADKVVDVQKLFREFIHEALVQAGAPEDVQAVFVASAPEEPVVPVRQERVSSAWQGDNSSRFKGTLIQSLTFDQFVQGPSNQFAVAMAKAVATNPGKESTNPLFMYGPTGVGKTHLLHAIGNLALQENPNLNVLYTTTENLMNEYMHQWSQRENLEQAKEAFRKKFRTPDILLVDDIQGMKSEGLQNEFFNIFNELRDHGRQIVMTSDQAPRDIPNLMERLVSRFENGINADIDVPAYETRFNIIMMKLQAHPEVKLSREVIEFIAMNVKSSVRALEGALSTTINYAQILPPNSEQNITVTALKESILRKYILQEQTVVKLTNDDVLREVCKFFGVSKEKIFSDSRERDATIPRQIAMFLCRKLTETALIDIGRYFGRKHSTISHACLLIQDQFKAGDATTVNAIRAILTELGTSVDTLS